MKEVKSKNFILYADDNNWLGQVVITDDGFFGSVTDYGNLSYAWRSYGDDFRKFLCNINIHYLGTKLYTGMSYIVHNRKCEQACDKYAEKILPALQKALNEDIKMNPEW